MTHQFCGGGCYDPPLSLAKGLHRSLEATANHLPQSWKSTRSYFLAVGGGLVQLSPVVSREVLFGTIWTQERVRRLKLGATGHLFVIQQVHPDPQFEKPSSNF